MTDRPPSSSSAAPPTVRGALGRAGLPTSRTAASAMVCGIAGLLLVPAALAAVILGIVGLRKVHASRGGLQGNGLAIAGISLGLVGVVVSGFFFYVMGWMAITARREMLLQKPMIEQQMIHAWMQLDAEAQGGYPLHAASMALNDSSFPTRARVNGLIDTVYTPVQLGTYDLSSYDGSAAERDALSAALAALDTSSPYYRCGDFWFVRLAQPTNRNDIVFSWHDDPGQNVVLVTMDDGLPQRVPPAEWTVLWETDADAREELSLEPIDPAPPLAPR